MYYKIKIKQRYINVNSLEKVPPSNTCVNHKTQVYIYFSLGIFKKFS